MLQKTGVAWGRGYKPTAIDVTASYLHLTYTGDCNTDADRVLSGLEQSLDDDNSPSIVDVEDTSDACVSIADSDIDDSPSDLEDSSTREAYSKLYKMADVTVYDSYLLPFQYATP